MADPNPSSFLEDPLSTITREERRNLLISCVITALVSHAGLLPTEISALGIKITSPEQSVFILVLAAVVFYFSFAFLIYGITDLFIWRRKYQDYLSEVQSYMESWTEEDQQAYDMDHLPKIAWLYRWAPRIAYIRIFFEYGLPVLFGLYAIYALLSKAIYS